MRNVTSNDSQDGWRIQGLWIGEKADIGIWPNRKIVGRIAYQSIETRKLHEGALYQGYEERGGG